MSWYAYHRGRMADRSRCHEQQDADALAPPRVSRCGFDGEFTPPSMKNPSMATAL